MKKCCEYLREHAIEITNLKKQRMKSLTNEQKKWYQNAKMCYICKEKLKDTHAKDKKYWKVRDHCYYTGKYKDAAHSICKLKIYLKKFL